MNTAQMIDAAQIVSRMQASVGAETSASLAKRLGLSACTLNVWEKQNCVPIACLAHVAREMDVSLDWLVFGVVGERESRPRTYEEATRKISPLGKAATCNLVDAAEMGRG